MAPVEAAEVAQEKDRSKAVPVEEIVPGFELLPKNRFNEGKGRYYHTPYLENLDLTLDIQDEAVKKAMQRFKDQVIVDLGAGTQDVGYRFSQDLGARAYVGVEENYADNLAWIISEPVGYDSFGEHKKTHSIPYSVVDRDMLTFLQGLPDGSVSVLMSGIDTSLLSDPDYREAVLREIDRVLHPDGAYLSFNSDIRPGAIHKRDERSETWETGREGKGLEILAKDNDEGLVQIWVKKRRGEE